MAKVNLAKTHYFIITFPEFIKSDPQTFWRYLGSNKEVLTKIKVDGNFVTEGKEIAKILTNISKV